MTDIDIDATRQTPEVAEPGNNTFAVWFDQNRDPFLTFYREDAYASDKVRWFNADQYDTGDDDGPKSWAALCELAEGMKGPELLVPGAKVDELTAALTQSRAQAATYANEIGTLKAHNSRLRTKLAERGLPDDADHWVNFNGVCEDDCPECAALKATRAEATR